MSGVKLHVAHLPNFKSDNPANKFRFLSPQIASAEAPQRKGGRTRHAQNTL